MKLERRADGNAIGAGVWVAGLLLAGAGAAALWLRLGLPGPACRLRELTGLPCVTCGSTRLVEALLAGDPAAALAHNPLVFVALVAAACWSVAALARLATGRPGWRLALASRERYGVGLTVLAMIVADWVYVLWRHA